MNEAASGQPPPRTMVEERSTRKFKRSRAEGQDDIDAQQGFGQNDQPMPINPKNSTNMQQDKNDNNAWKSDRLTQRLNAPRTERKFYTGEGEPNAQEELETMVDSYWLTGDPSNAQQVEGPRIKVSDLQILGINLSSSLFISLIFQNMSSSRENSLNTERLSASGSSSIDSNPLLSLSFESPPDSPYDLHLWPSSSSVPKSHLVIKIPNKHSTSPQMSRPSSSHKELVNALFKGEPPYPLPTLKTPDADTIRREFYIPSAYEIIIPKSDEFMFDPPDGCRTFFVSTLESRLWFSIPEPMKNILRHLELCPTQLMPNSYCLIACFIVIMQLFGLEHSWAHFWTLFQINESNVVTAISLQDAMIENKLLQGKDYLLTIAREREYRLFVDGVCNPFSKSPSSKFEARLDETAHSELEAPSTDFHHSNAPASDPTRLSPSDKGQKLASQISKDTRVKKAKHSTRSSSFSAPKDQAPSAPPGASAADTRSLKCKQLSACGIVLKKRDRFGLLSDE
ncbi:hypothetical protein BUALT_Bualt17G0042700 [Buddleja alternifolia]|uniref:Uncharacterized protein n=1 Tax=Buddleja alternifolia TaxID=168488 RepID=A0AAV6W664_9LAMI|nr:hypothetical protein BUALT_Bualt17G0042700 [Buddleja alternifolia]